MDHDRGFGVAVASLYYNQSMLADMMRSLRVTPHEIGLVATFTQVGYALGMPLFVPLGDFVESRWMRSVQAAQVANQSRVLGLRPEARNRVNTVYMISYFSGGSLGSLLGSWAWSHWRWHGVCATGVLFTSLAGLVFLARGPSTTQQRSTFNGS